MSSSKTVLHRVRGRNRWCGPAVISAIAGVSTDEAAAALRKWSGRRRITTVTVLEIDLALREFGYKLGPRESPAGMSVGRWVAGSDYEGVAVVKACDHALATWRRLVACSIYRQPTNILIVDPVYLSQRVDAIYAVASPR